MKQVRIRVRRRPGAVAAHTLVVANPLRPADENGLFPGYDPKVESTWGTALGRCNKLV